MDSINNNYATIIRNEFYKYLSFWKWYLLSVIIFISMSFIFLRYTHNVYKSTAKIKMLDKNKDQLLMPTAQNIFNNNQINLENEIEIIKSYPILKKVVDELNLTYNFYSSGEIMTTRLVKFPFNFVHKSLYNPLNEKIEYNIKFTEENILIEYNDKTVKFTGHSTIKQNHDLPFDCSWDIDNIINNSYTSFTLELIPEKIFIEELKKNLSVSVLGKKSEIISINYISENPKYSENIINSLIRSFNDDGVNDRQLVHQRTISFVNERFFDLSVQLDSIETKKQKYKLENNFIDIESNSSISLELNSKYNEELFYNENQIILSEMLLVAYEENDYDLLPANILLDNNSVNELTNEYNDLVLKRRNLSLNLGENNTTLKNIDINLNQIKSNIISSVKSYILQLNKRKQQLSNLNSKFNLDLNKIPEKEKVLRAIERNQIIQEKLFLYLLQKREEAEVNYAITEPTVKVVEYAISENKPHYPNRSIIYFLSLVFAFVFPSTIIYLILLFDTKIHSRHDLENKNLNIVGEIPFFDLPETEKVFTNPDDRSIISESFRMLMSNVRYLLKNDTKSNVILVTSSIKGEGKTLNALNLALSFSSVGKKVLLLGCDLRNPQLHKYFNYDKNVPGLVDYLVDNKTEWKKNILHPFVSQNLDILLSGPLPPNPLNLINNGNIDILLKDARKTYDHIIIDSAPTLLVADTQSLISKSDILIFITRCNVTEKDVLSHISKVSEESETNVGVVLNGVGQKNSYGYSYGYRYGYGYNYKYSYNYGYGYGYSSDDEKS